MISSGDNESPNCFFLVSWSKMGICVRHLAFCSFLVGFIFD